MLTLPPFKYDRDMHECASPLIEHDDLPTTTQETEMGASRLDMSGIDLNKTQSTHKNMLEESKSIHTQDNISVHNMTHIEDGICSCTNL